MNRTPVISISLVVAAIAISAISWQRMQPEAPEGFNLAAFERLPVQQGGRIKPMGSFAETVMLAISDKRTWKDAEGVRRPASQWLLDAMTMLPDRPGAAVSHSNPASLRAQVFRIEHDGVLDTLGLEPRDGFRYAAMEFADALPATEGQFAAAQAAEPARRTLHQEKLVELREQWATFKALVERRTPGLIPPPDGEQWPALIAFMQPDTGQVVGALPGQFAQMLQAWRAGDADAFNRHLADYQQAIEAAAPGAVRDAGVEYYFTQARPMLHPTLMYLIALLVVCIGWLGGWRSLITAAVWLAIVAFVIHTAALGMRMYIQGRPPVTNLYSSAVFAGWVAVALALVMEWIFRNGLNAAIGSVVGFATLIIAINLELARDGQTMGTMQAVLDTNFWLATHVTTITMGYGGTFLAGALGIFYILAGLFTRQLDPAADRSLARMIYGVICFALLFSFVGTVLGGIWADQSWGRFWGWDPKENGALIIVLWNALILHARFGGMIRNRGLAVCAVFGNVVTAWSWFGVNMLGVGLHAYATASGAVTLGLFVISQLFIMALGLLPDRLWRSRAPA